MIFSPSVSNHGRVRLLASLSNSYYITILDTTLIETNTLTTGIFNIRALLQTERP